MYQNTRRIFLRMLGLGFLVFLFKIEAGNQVKVRREVIFPREMSREEFDSIVSQSHNCLEIAEFNRNLMEQGLLICGPCNFEKTRTSYNLTFASAEVYRYWLDHIGRNWFDQARFSADGFEIHLHRIS